MSNEIRGTVATKGTMTGNLGAVFGKDGKSAYEVAVKNGFDGSEAEWLASLKGADGTMSFEDLTPAQKESLKGDKGEKGNSGVYVGSGEMPADCNVQIDPNGDCFTLDEELDAMKAELSAQLTPASDATPLMNGVAAVGTAEAYARGDHRHPTDTTRLGVNEFNEFKSDLEIGLDNIIAIQNSLIGGGSQ